MATASTLIATIFASINIFTRLGPDPVQFSFTNEELIRFPLEKLYDIHENIVTMIQIFKECRWCMNQEI